MFRKTSLYSKAMNKELSLSRSLFPSGHFGLWLDEMLYLGRSSPCYTFNNCCLSERDDFHVMELEVWTFW